MYVHSQKFGYFGHWLSDVNTLEMKNFDTHIKGGFPVIAETTRNHTFSKEISQVVLAAMILAPNFYCKNCQRVISAMRGNPPLVFICNTFNHKPKISTKPQNADF